MLLKNLDLTRGLANGTRLQIMRFTNEHLVCRILTGPRRDLNQEYWIPKCKHEYGNKKHHRGIKFRRIQFPVRPCFAMTVNKVLYELIA